LVKASANTVGFAANRESDQQAILAGQRQHVRRNALRRAATDPDLCGNALPFSLLIKGTGLGATGFRVTLIGRNQFAAYIIVITILSVLVFTVSCRKSMSHSSMGAMEPSPQSPAPNGVALKTYQGVGVIEKIDRKNNVIQINHEEIRGYMPAQTQGDKEVALTFRSGISISCLPKS
jgi:hypothetical protein